MLRLSLFLLLSRTLTADITEPTLADRIGKLYEKLEKFTIAPEGRLEDNSPDEKLYAKLDKLNSIMPKELSEEDEELLSALQVWGSLSPEQLEKVVKDLQSVDVKSEKMVDGDYNDGDWGDEDVIDGDYANDDWDSDYSDGSTAKPAVVTPSAITKLSSYQLVTVDPILATNERPRIIDDSAATPFQLAQTQQAVYAHIRAAVRASKCSEPQPRWLAVKHLAPAASTRYLPPCVELHRCAADSGCCYDESQVCAPAEGEYVTLPLYLQKADGSLKVSRMVFYNHTRCGCVPRERLHLSRPRLATHQRDASEHAGHLMANDHRRPSTLTTPEESRTNQIVRRESLVATTERMDRQNDWRSTEEPHLNNDEEGTAPPQIRRCTCPTLFLARLSDSGCACVCDWPEPSRRRDCLSLSRGREHFGLRDRVCVINGSCTEPTCEHGVYDRSSGKCPLKRVKRYRYHRSRPIVF